MVSLIVFLFVPWHGPAVLSYDVLFHDPLQLPFQFIGGLAGSILSITLMMVISKVLSGKWKDLLTNVGCYTLAIYGLQGVLLENVVEKIWSIDEEVCPMDIQQYIVAPIIGVLTVLVCYGVAKLAEKNKLTALVLLGKKLA